RPAREADARQDPGRLHGRVRPHPQDQREQRARPLSARLERHDRRRRHPGRPDHRGHRQGRRRGQGAPGDGAGPLRDGVPGGGRRSKEEEHPAAGTSDRAVRQRRRGQGTAELDPKQSFHTGWRARQGPATPFLFAFCRQFTSVPAQNPRNSQARRLLPSCAMNIKQLPWLASALSMTAGLYLLAGPFRTDRSDIAHLLPLWGVLTVYEVVVIGMIAVLRRRGVDTAALTLVSLFFLADPIFLGDAFASIGTLPGSL